MGTRLILICNEGAARRAYVKEAKALGADIDVVSNYHELYKTMIDSPYQGILIDLVTNMKMSKEEKFKARDVLEIFPALQLKWDADSGSIRSISFGKSSGSDSLDEFIRSECRSFTPRAIRLDMRKAVHLNVLLSRDETMIDKHLERSVTLNLSKGGCFLFSGLVWNNHATVWLMVKELRDKSPVVGEIRWMLEWGKHTTIPGIGVSFKQIKRGQIEELIDNYAI
jgi:hypothetical protein